MTKDMLAETVALKALLSNIADHQLLAEMLGFVAKKKSIFYQPRKTERVPSQRLEAENETRRIVDNYLR